MAVLVKRSGIGRGGPKKNHGNVKRITQPSIRRLARVGCFQNPVEEQNDEEIAFSWTNIYWFVAFCEGKNDLGKVTKRDLLSRKEDIMRHLYCVKD